MGSLSAKHVVQCGAATQVSEITRFDCTWPTSNVLFHVASV